MAPSPSPRKAAIRTKFVKYASTRSYDGTQRITVTSRKSARKLARNRSICTEPEEPTGTNSCGGSVRDVTGKSDVSADTNSVLLLVLERRRLRNTLCIPHSTRRPPSWPRFSVHLILPTNLSSTVAAIGFPFDASGGMTYDVRGVASGGSSRPLWSFAPLFYHKENYTWLSK
jgi:hypothetical protein